MVSILAHAQNLVYTLLSLMPSVYQQENLEAMLGMFLEAQGHPLPQHSKSKSASALSRFLNIHKWSTRGVIRTVCNRVINEIVSEQTLGRQPFLQVIIDLTTLEKAGKFKALENAGQRLPRKTRFTFGCGVFSSWSVANTVEFPRMSGEKAPLLQQGWD
ncbi:MAG: hypothetical protein IGS39_04405 [Calothrix sp. C42_A2020_038]|nr:hypothetical protein [Calothrix sp. C42_A2020_038]